MTPSELKLSDDRTPAALAGMSPDTPVLVAFSGGADSVALLHMLIERRKKDGFPLTLAHVNHGIRGDEALRDRTFCVSQAQRLGLEICVLDADVPQYARENGLGIEEAARNIRYAYFASLMQEKNIPILVTAHHADDNLETVLFRLARGTGARGLQGISPARAFEGGMLVRPLLPFSKSALLRYCEENRLEYVTDSTNTDTAYARNRIRAEVVPVMEELFAGVAERTTDLCAFLREDDQYLSSQAQAFLAAYEEHEPISLAALRRLPAPIARRALLTWVEQVCERSPEAVHLQALWRLVTGDTPDACVALPNGRTAYAQGDGLCVRIGTPSPFIPYRFPFAYGEMTLPETAIRICVLSADDIQKVHNLSTPTYTILTVGLAIIKKDLYWRSRQAGDVLLKNGMHRKLRKLYAEANVPVHLRERIPLLCDEEGIVWAPMVGLRDGIVASENAACTVVKVCIPKEMGIPIEKHQKYGGNAFNGGN